MCKHPIEMLTGTHDGIRCQCGAVFASWAELEAARNFASWAELEAARKEPEEEPAKKPKRRKKTTE